MRRTTLLISTGVAVFIGTTVWWATARDSISDDPDELVVISVDGTQMSKEPEDRVFARGSEFLYDCAVLGRVAITDPTTRREIIAAVKADIRAGSSTRAKCFQPRHVLRVVKDGVVVDVVVCYQCHNYEIHRNGGPHTGLTPAIGDGSRPLLNRILTGAGVAIVPD